MELMMITSMWESMAAWFTPTVLFCLTNFIIATIFIASNKHYDHQDSSASLNPLTRVSSFIDRARSMNLSSYTTSESQHHYPVQPKTANYSSLSRLAQSIYLSDSEGISGSLSQPARVQSLFERVKSNKFSSEYNENVFPVQSNSPGQLSRHELAGSEEGSLSQPTRVQSMFERVKSVKFSSEYNENVFPIQSNSSGQLSRPELAESEGGSLSQPARVASLFERVKSIKFSNESNSPGQLARAPSFFNRVKSFKTSSVLKTEPASTNQEHNVNRSQSEKKPAKKVEMKKSRSEVKIVADEDEDVDIRRPATARESRKDMDEEVDAKADYFISRFKQQLKLQRLESLVRYNEMLNRGR